MSLEYPSDRPFRIVQITDTHLGPKPYVADDEKTWDMLRRILKTQQVDLLIHTGDVVWTEGVPEALESFTELMELIDASGVPAAITYGNHDTEGDFPRAELRRIAGETVSNLVEPAHVTVDRDQEAFVIELTRGGELANVIYVIDSGDYDRTGTDTYAFNEPEIVDWFRATASGYAKGRDELKTDIVFQHIPVPEYWTARENILSGEARETDEAVSCPGINTGLFSAMLLDGHTWGMSVGHDHENSFDGIAHGLHLVYGQCSGYNAYGDLPRGIRVFELDGADISTFTIHDDQIG